MKLIKMVLIVLFSASPLVASSAGLKRKTKRKELKKAKQFSDSAAAVWAQADFKAKAEPAPSQPTNPSQPAAAPAAPPAAAAPRRAESEFTARDAAYVDLVIGLISRTAPGIQLATDGEHIAPTSAIDKKNDTSGSLLPLFEYRASRENRMHEAARLSLGLEDALYIYIREFRSKAKSPIKHVIREFALSNFKHAFEEFIQMFKIHNVPAENLAQLLDLKIKPKRRKNGAYVGKTLLDLLMQMKTYIKDYQTMTPLEILQHTYANVPPLKSLNINLLTIKRFIYEIRCGHVEIVKKLYSKYKDILLDVCNEYGYPIVLYAALHDQAEIIEYLREQGFNPNVQSRQGLIASIFASDPTTLNALILNKKFPKKYNINETDANGCTAFLTACDSEQLLICQSLHDVLHADVGTFNKNMQNALDIAFKNEDQAMLQWLLTLPAFAPNEHDMYGRQPWVTATLNAQRCVHGESPCAHKVIRNDLKKEKHDVNAIGSDGLTSLQAAIRAGRADVVGILLDNGADYKITEAGKMRPYPMACHYLDIAKRTNDRRADYETIVSLLKAKKADEYEAKLKSEIDQKEKNEDAAKTKNLRPPVVKAKVKNANAYLLGLAQLQRDQTQATQAVAAVVVSPENVDKAASTTDSKLVQEALEIELDETAKAYYEQLQKKRGKQAIVQWRRISALHAEKNKDIATDFFKSKEQAKQQAALRSAFKHWSLYAKQKRTERDDAQKRLEQAHQAQKEKERLAQLEVEKARLNELIEKKDKAERLAIAREKALMPISSPTTYPVTEQASYSAVPQDIQPLPSKKEMIKAWLLVGKKRAPMNDQELAELVYEQHLRMPVPGLAACTIAQSSDMRVNNNDYEQWLGDHIKLHIDRFFDPHYKHELKCPVCRRIGFINTDDLKKATQYDDKLEVYNQAIANLRSVVQQPIRQLNPKAATFVSKRKTA